MSLDDFENLSLLGDGAYSTVYKVRRTSDGQIYALKKVKVDNLSDKEKENALNEVRILASIKNPCVICYKESFIDTDSQSLCLVIEYADDGDLFQKISASENGFEETFIWKVFIQVVRGLRALHDLSIMHRDLKSANVFLNKDGTAKLGDMNVSKLTDMKGLNYTQTGTPYYASPEVWKDRPYSIKSDIWSLGCVLYEMITFKPPFRASNMEGLFRKVSKGLYQPIPKKYSTELSNLVRSLLKANPDKRPDCDEIIAMPSVMKKISILFPESEQFLESSELLKTIRFPKNFMYLTNQLPKPSYEEEVDEDFTENIKASTLPFKQKVNKSSEPLANRGTLSRSKANTASKNSIISERMGSQSSVSKHSKNTSKAQIIMKNNLSKKEISPKMKYKNIVKNQNNLSIKSKKEDMIKKDMSMNINSHKIAPLNISSSRTPHVGVIGLKKRNRNHIILSNKKSPIVKNMKKGGPYNRNRPPLYERDHQDINASSLPVIVNSLSPSGKRLSSSNDSQEIIKKYEIKGKIMKPSQRLVQLRYGSKKSPSKSPGGSSIHAMKYIGHKKLSHQISGTAHNSNLIKQAIAYQPQSPIRSIKGIKRNTPSKVSLPSISMTRSDGPRERKGRANNLHMLIRKK
ncbi:unnamed protein product [Moneuplotes crassus]|uniref:non-specific serine/threonine protein kinase n=1 Tax=Euplotes crassus TaxID=5936 RepID=A0AAD1U5E8_EUPCR|nr:unnamed protein product [Moneuplotes crassus]